MYKIIERNMLPNGDKIQLEDWSEMNTLEFSELHGLCIAAYPLVARSDGYSIARPGERFRLQISFNSYAGYTNEMVRADYEALVRGEKKLEDLAEYFYYQKRDEWKLGMGSVSDYPRI